MRKRPKHLALASMGSVMPGTGGFCKVRWKDARRGKGKRGRLCVIWYYLSADYQARLLTLYDKDEAADPTTKEKKVLKKAIQAESEASRRKPRNESANCSMN